MHPPRNTFLFFCCAHLAYAQNYFINPPSYAVNYDYSNNLHWPLGSTQELRWTTSYNESQLWLNQENNTLAQVFLNGIIDPSSQGFTWPVSTSADLSRTNIFFFTLRDANDNSSFFYSHYFNITPPTQSSAQPPGSQGISSGAKAGIGVGVGVGAAVIVGLSIGVFCLLRKNRRERSGEQPPMYSHVAQDRKEAGERHIRLDSIAELGQAPPGGNPRAELPDRPRDRAHGAGHEPIELPN